MNLRGFTTKRFHPHIEEALMSMAAPVQELSPHRGCAMGDEEPETSTTKLASEQGARALPIIIGDPIQGSPNTSRRPIQTSSESGGISGMPSVGDTCGILG